MEERPLRVAFCGNDRWSVPALTAIARSAHEIVLVVTAEPKPAGRGSALRPTAVAEASRALDLDPLETGTIRTGRGLEALRDAAPDVLVVVAYGELLSPEVLAVPARLPVNVHFSLLPALRGAAPVQHALLLGMTETGVTTMRVDPGLDTGPILLQRAEPIRPDDDTGSLGSRLASAGGELLVETLGRIAAGRVSEIPQEDADASWAPKLGAEERVLEWTRPAAELLRRIRALAPSPAATTRFRDRGLKVFRAAVVDDPDPGAAPGALGAGEDGMPLVGTGEGALALLEVGPEGRGRMSGDAWLRGVRPLPGDRLG